MMVCCARVMMGGISGFGIVFGREFGIGYLRKVVELFVSS